MSLVTIVLLGAGVLFVSAAIHPGPNQKSARSAKRKELICPEDGRPATVWAVSPKEGKPRVESCSKRALGRACHERCLLDTN